MFVRLSTSGLTWACLCTYSLSNVRHSCPTPVICRTTVVVFWIFPCGWIQSILALVLVELTQSRNVKLKIQFYQQICMIDHKIQMWNFSIQCPGFTIIEVIRGIVDYQFCRKANNFVLQNFNLEPSKFLVCCLNPWHNFLRNDTIDRDGTPQVFAVVNIL